MNTYLAEELVAGGYDINLDEEKEMSIDMETKPNLRLVSKAQAYGPRGHFFYQAVKVSCPRRKKGDETMKRFEN